MNSEDSKLGNTEILLEETKKRKQTERKEIKEKENSDNIVSLYQSGAVTVNNTSCSSSEVL